MNTDTKRHMDSARQVLVGVVPNPTSQIDQITNALIYKFMDDMDQSAIKAGGDPSFFTGDLEPYAWTRLMDPRMGNQERMNLYGEALIKFSQAKQLPELFRGIFKSASLPYRSPETLGLFLKEIDYFDYSHPEELGNAYEYLLSIMSSQGDAGQFRTPRHIIDFIVDVVNPTKNDKVLDPACGTGGFLVSSYTHILEQHDGKNDPKKKEKPLTPDERKKLMANFEGYDIDPGMQRIAQVNMYLHQFKNPKIYQYNTLADEEKWNDKFDVILANPPFMSPKGAGKPHRKFTIDSSRSEVLFVDYIMNHLRPKGRAGIIVPEGIIFQSGKAHKELRKNLVNDGLYAVVSLPSGVFNPYAGVKTSILFFNNELAKTSKEILFVRIENDGFDLGATKRPISKNDLPLAVEVLKAFQRGGWMAVDKIPHDPTKILTADKEREIPEKEYNLSIDRYRVTTDYTNAKWPMVRLDDIFTEIKNGKNVGQIDEVGKYRVSRIQTISTGEVDLEKTKYTNDEVNENDFLQEGDILFSHINSIDHLAKTAIFENTKEKVVHGANLIRLRADKNKVMPKYALFVFKSEDFIETARSFAQKAVNQASINSTAIKNFKIPLPPLEVQEQIVTELNGYQNIIAGAKQIITSWKPTIDIDPKWEKAKLGEVVDIYNGSTPKRTEPTYWGNGTIPWFTIDDIRNQGRFITKTEQKITEKGFKESSVKLLPKDTVLLCCTASIGEYAFSEIELTTNQQFNGLVVKEKDKLNPKYLFWYSSFLREELERMSGKATFGFVAVGTLKNFEIPLPPLEIQKQIVEHIESERTLVEGNKKLIDIYDQKTKKAIAKFWEE